MIELKDLKLGQTLLAVHKDYADKKTSGGRVVRAKVVGFVNKSGKVVAELKIGSSPQVATTETYRLYKNTEDAIEAISW
jgi:hypothetical protein